MHIVLEKICTLKLSPIAPFRDSKATLASTSKECDTSITTTLGSVIGVLVALQVGTLITLCVVVVYWKHSVKSKQRLFVCKQ